MLPLSPRGVRVSPFPPGPGFRRGQSKPSQVPTQDVRACPSSLTPRSPAGPHLGGPAGVAFDRDYSLGTSDPGAFDAHWPGPHAPLPTLRRHPHECPRTARGETWMVGPSFQRTFTAYLVPVSLAHSPPSYSPNSGPNGDQRKQPRRRGGTRMSPLRVPHVFKEVPHRRAAGMIRPETGRGWSISDAHHVTAVQRLGPYRAGGGDDTAAERCDPAGRPQGVPLRSAGIGSFKDEEEGEGSGVFAPTGTGVFPGAGLQSANTAKEFGAPKTPMFGAARTPRQSCNGQECAQAPRLLPVAGWGKIGSGSGPVDAVFSVFYSRS